MEDRAPIFLEERNEPLRALSSLGCGAKSRPRRLPAISPKPSAARWQEEVLEKGTPGPPRCGTFPMNIPVRPGCLQHCAHQPSVSMDPKNRSATKFVPKIIVLPVLPTGDHTSSRRCPSSPPPAPDRSRAPARVPQPGTGTAPRASGYPTSAELSPASVSMPLPLLCGSHMPEKLVLSRALLNHILHNPWRRLPSSVRGRRKAKSGEEGAITHFSAPPRRRGDPSRALSPDPGVSPGGAARQAGLCAAGTHRGPTRATEGALCSPHHGLCPPRQLLWGCPVVPATSFVKPNGFKIIIK